MAMSRKCDPRQRNWQLISLTAQISGNCFSMQSTSRRTLCCYAVLLLSGSRGCERTNEESRARTVLHARGLADLSKRDAAEIRKGLPLGTVELGKLWKDADNPLTNLDEARRILNRAHDKVQ